ncbi:MAG: hypothetical protein P0S94_05680 [Simkaniaceae bacterium]|nr:hypothetical protein [Simkaniaceae bacterium]
MADMSGEKTADKSAEEKIEELVGVMRGALAQEGVPQFRVFWDARKAFHEVFKECKNPIFKSKIWKELTELTNEARRVKEILDEEARFAVEQIELALKGFVEDVEKADDSSGSIDLPEQCRELLDNKQAYLERQGRINHFTTMMLRLKEMRSEIIKTEMRIRHKNRLLKEISTIGDKFIPERKELIETLSDAFLADVQRFHVHHFGENAQSRVPLRILRDEIKGYQNAAKLLSVNSRVFKQSRDLLSKAWETISKKADENRQFYEEKREIFDENLKLLKPKIDAFVEKADGWKLTSLFNDYKALADELEKTLLDRQEKKELHDQIEKIFQQRRDVLQKKEAEARVKAAELKDAKIAEYEKSIATASRKSLETLKKLRVKLLEEGEAFSRFVAAVDLAILKKEGASDGAYAKWENLARECREKLSDLRKKMGGSGFDFEKAMEARAEYDATKERLAEIEKAINSL